MELFPRLIVRLSASLALGIGLIVPGAVHASGDTALTIFLPAIAHTASVDSDAMGDCCPRLDALAPLCKDAGLCAAKSRRPAVASVAGQGFNTGFTPQFWESVAKLGERLSARSSRLQVGRPKLSILFCSFQT